MFELLQQIPPGHHTIQRLVDFVADLKKLQVETLQIWGHNTRIWSNLPLFAPGFAEQVEQDTGDYEKSSLKAFRDLLEADGVLSSITRKCHLRQHDHVYCRLVIPIYQPIKQVDKAKGLLNFL